MNCHPTLRFMATATALVPVSFMSAAQAQERVAQDPHDSSRAANAAWIDQTGIPESCVNDVMTQASDACPNNCMIRLPNSALPKNDACDKRTWICDWPTQPVGESPNCPAGWVGTYHQDHYYEVQNCGTTMVDTGKINILSSNCTRGRPEEKVEACPTTTSNGVAAHWVGAGVTYQRIHNESLGTDLSTITENSVTDWVVKSVDCKRTVTHTVYEICPYLSGGCMSETVNGEIIANNCGTIPAQNNSVVSINQQHLANDLVTVVTDSSTNTATGARNDCPPPPPPPEPPPAPGDGEGDGDGDGGDPLVIDDMMSSVVDLASSGLDIIPESESKANFDWQLRGSKTKTPWFGPKEGILIYDANGNGQVDGVMEMFADKRGANGFSDLAKTVDTNKDGVVDEKDKVWAHLRVWIDANSDAVTQPGELLTMKQAGIKSITSVPEKYDLVVKGALVDYKSTVQMLDGTSRTIYNVTFPENTKLQ